MKTSNNTQEDLVAVLKENPYLTEDELMQEAFGYNRYAPNAESNKKYAKLLRRAMKAGKITRKECTLLPNNSKYVYYVPEA